MADTLYWIALLHPEDPWKQPGRRARAALGQVHLVTTDEVLTELLTALAGSPNLRRRAVQAVHHILEDPDITVVPQSRESFAAGLTLYERREDKHYSLTDCVSMEVMRAQRLAQVLTNDHHFTQEGFEVLIQAAQ